MLTENQNLIRTIDDSNIDDRSKIINMLYGLYDGYLYDDLLYLVKSSGIDFNTYDKLKTLVSKIELFIQTNGQGTTQV
tara:strand:+ start:113 stop:346 length:234 start_codon:yes stop_codon:yes gene_type:complete